eukprot:TRINITY_DN1457_c0_g1_i1.p2 TRINITY_DN1457_c0_g1~~TRINITY_DN1457_c0_g1_i1.p2  ORF type:complete len:190 (+),score=45.38 TRINITY_DN1457_c0_g1_i1:395-964(+)
MNKILFVVALFAVVALAVADPPKPTWPTAYQTFFKLTIEGKGRAFVVHGKQYFDYHQQQERFDYPDAREQHALDIVLVNYREQKSYELKHHEQDCVFHNLTHHMEIPDFRFFDFVGETTLNGRQVNHWHMGGEHAVDYFNDAGNGTPVQWTGDGMTWDYFDWDSSPQDPTIFWLPPGVKCHAPKYSLKN